MEELYNIIGKLYVDIYNAQKYIESLQNILKEKDKTIADLRIDRKNNVEPQ
jgi:hypothetical protein